ncbi:MAG: HAD family phosphatase [Reichenbachiella sp.]
MLKAVIFDMDGVLMNSEEIHYQVERDIIKRYGVEFEVTEHTKYVGQRTIDLWTGVCKNHGLDVDPAELALEDNQSYMQALQSGDIEPIEGIPELIAELKKEGIKMIVASSATRHNIETVMSKFVIEEDFEGYASGQDVKRPKPNPDIFLLASEKLNMSPSECVVIEDAKHGVHAAKAAGMTCIGYRNASSGNQDLSAADVIVNRIEEIDIDLLNRIIN